jgi:predicted anti-sigma-YlaC factor YlaD
MVEPVRIFHRTLPVAVALSAVLAACGSSSNSQDVAQIKQTLTRAFRALARGDGATMCSLATPAGQKTLASAVPHSSCASVISLVAAHLSAAQKAGLSSVRIKNVTLHGNHASVSDADLSAAHGTLKGFLQPGSAPTQLTKESDGSWKISG